MRHESLRLAHGRYHLEASSANGVTVQVSVPEAGVENELQIRTAGIRVLASMEEGRRSYLETCEHCGHVVEDRKRKLRT